MLNYSTTPYSLKSLSVLGTLCLSASLITLTACSTDDKAAQDTSQIRPSSPNALAPALKNDQGQNNAYRGVAQIRGVGFAPNMGDLSVQDFYWIQG